MVDTSKSTARYDTSVDIKKEKKICQIYKSFFFISSELTPCPASPRAPGFGACVAPVILRWTRLTGNLRIPFFFDSKKEHQPRLEWKIEKHKWSFSARLAVTSSWSFWSSTIHVALVKARWKTWRHLWLHVAPRVAVCIPVVPAATNARIARTNEAPAFVVAVGHIIIN